MKRIILFLILFCTSCSYKQEDIVIVDDGEPIIIKLRKGHYLSEYVKDYRIDGAFFAIEDVDLSKEGQYFIRFKNDKEQIYKNIIVTKDVDDAKYLITLGKIKLYTKEDAQSFRDILNKPKEEIRYYCKEKHYLNFKILKRYIDFFKDAVYAEDSGNSKELVDRFVKYLYKQDGDHYRLVEYEPKELKFGDVIEYAYNEDFGSNHYAIYLSDGYALHGNFAIDRVNKAVVCPVEVEGFQIYRYWEPQVVHYYVNSDENYIPDYVYFEEDYSEEGCMVTIPSYFVEDYREMIEWCEENSYDDLITYTD